MKATTGLEHKIFANDSTYHDSLKRMGTDNMLQKLRNNKKGFTLIELMIVIAIIGILAAIAIPNFIAYRDKAFCGDAEYDAHNTLSALSSYYADPDHTGIPTIAQLISLEDLSVNNTVGNVDLTGSITGVMTVTITDGSGRCPRQTVFSATMGGAEGYWTQ
jgi:prepilin-type N-terminal cleavage/methylation domain-containing protein